MTTESAPETMVTRGPNAIEAGMRVKCSKCGHEGDAWLDPNPLLVEWLNRFADATMDGLYQIQALVLAGQPVPLSMVVSAIDSARDAINPNVVSP